MSIDVTKLVQAFPDMPVARAYVFAGFCVTGIVVLLCILLALYGVIGTMKPALEMWAVSAVLVGVFVSTVLRFAWWTMLREPVETFDRKASAVAVFFRLPDVIVGLIGFLTVLLFCYLWVSALTPVFLPKRSLQKPFRIGFLITGGSVTLYAFAIVVCYAKMGSASNIYDPYMEIQQTFPPLPFDKTALVEAVLGSVLCLVLIIYCSIGLKIIAKSSQDKVSVIKYLIVSIFLFMSMCVKLVYSASVDANLWPSYIFIFGINYALAEFVIGMSLLFFVFSAFYSFKNVRRPGLSQSDSTISSSCDSSDSYDAPLLVPQQYQV